MRTGIVQVFNVGSTGAIGAIEFQPGGRVRQPEKDRRFAGNPSGPTGQGQVKDRS